MDRTIENVRVLTVDSKGAEVGFDPVEAQECFPRDLTLRFGVLHLSRNVLPQGCTPGAVGYLRWAQTRIGSAWVLVLNGRP